MTLAESKNPPKKPKVYVGFRILEESRARIMALGDTAAERFGEGARPTLSEIARTLLAVSMQHPSVKAEVSKALVSRRLR